MKREKKMYCTAVAVLCAAIAVFIAFPAGAVAEEMHKTVVVKRMPDGLSVNPLQVKRGVTVIWINSDPTPMTIKILTKVGIACKAPVNFYANLSGDYESTPIPQQGVASICFIDKGEYRYEVRRVVKFNDKPTEEIMPGRVIVE